ncbi:MAG TPA: choice-of-anchor tandem repeat GloVer-containing protein [Candidatus Cybelea sp.]
MKTPGLSLCALLVCGVAAATACTTTTQLARFQYTPNVNGLRNAASPLSYRVLHDFGADHDGIDPTGLVGIGDTFYGTSAGGGGWRGGGTVFSVTTSGAENVLHRFGKGLMGLQPYAGVIDLNGTLYGTTSSGGTFGDGTVFSMTTDGSEKVLHNFGNGSDGKYPSASLVAVNGALYGTTNAGGTNSCSPSEGCGTVFSITTGGKEKVLHSFGKGTDGSFPYAPLIDISGTLYGTTAYGGEYGAGQTGTVFSITRDGAEKVLHSFAKGHDGALPEAGLIYVSGKLYGTTWQGGTQNSGTIFSVTRGGSERVLHSFGKGTDGTEAYGGLTDVGGTLYGTTIGGGNGCTRSVACGIVFSMTTTGSEKVLHDFGKGTDGSGPLGYLTYKNGSLFGVTEQGGVKNGGTVFSLPVK